MTGPIIEDDYSEIPDALKNRRQWLLWDASADTPRRPHWDGDFGVSWTDPNDWHTFEEAIELAASVKSWGIGYVFHDVGPYTFIDLDGCLRERTRPKDWLPSLDPFVDETYIEVSASGTGLHVILEDFAIPEWWSDTHFSDDEHEGVEVYNQKFCAFTGSPVAEITGETVATLDDQDVRQWLIQASKSINDEDPLKQHAERLDEDRDAGRSTDDDDELSEDLVRDALSHIDPDVTYSLWRDIGFALKDHFGSTSRALSVFKDWSRGGRKWDADAEQQAERIIKDAQPGGGRTIGTVIYHAQENGWEFPQRSQSSDTRADPADVDDEQVERGEAILQRQTAPDDPAGELDDQHGRYGIPWVNRDSDGNIVDSGFDPICNFRLETLSFLETDDGVDMVVRVHPESPTEEPYDVRIEPVVFNSVEQFRRDVVIGRTTWFDPSNREHVPNNTLLRYLRETVSEQPAPYRQGEPHIGLSSDYTEFVTPDGSLTAAGWADEPQYEFYAKGGQSDEDGALAQKWALSPDRGVEYDDEAVQEYCALAWQTRKPERGLPILGWFYSAPVKALIHDWEQEFPLLSATGDTGTGKTSTIELFQRMFGGTGEPLSSTDTNFALQKHLAESRGFPVWVDEYKPTEIPDHKLDHLHQRLKEVTKERSMPKGRTDLGIDMLWMRAPVVVSGEQQIADPPVRRRSVMTKLAREPTSDGTETKQAFGELTGVAYESPDGEQQHPAGYDPLEHAIAYYRWVMAVDNDQLEAWWQDARSQMKEFLSYFGVTVEESEQRGIQTVLFGARLHREFATAHGVPEDRLPTERQLREAVAHIIDNIGKDGHRREHADDWMELLSLAASEDYLTAGEHYRLVDSQKYDCEALAVHMPSAFPAVKKFLREFNLEEEYTVLNRTDYLDSFRDKADVDHSYVLAVSQRVRNLENGTKAVYFDPDRVRETLGSDFNVSAFRDDEPLEEDAGDATAIADLDASGNPYTTVTVEVNTWDAGPDGGPAESGVFEDETGTIDAVDFMGCDVSEALDPGETVRVENARVSTYDGTLQLEIVQNTTEVTPIQQGVGHTGSSDPDSGGDVDASQASLDDSAGGQTGEAATDGAGEIQNMAPQVVMIVRELEADHADGVPHATVVESLVEDGHDESSAEHGITAALEDGSIQEPKSDHYRTT